MKKCLVAMAVLLAVLVWGADRVRAMTPDEPTGVGTTTLAAFEVSQAALEPDASTDAAASGYEESVDSGYDASVWTIRADAVFLQRQTPPARVLVTDSFAPGGNVVLDASDFKFPMAAGFALDVIRHDVRNSGWDLEGAFLDVDSFSAASDTVRSPNGAVSQFAVPLGNTQYAADVTGYYRSQLRSVELNARRPWNDWLTLLGGFRYIDLREHGVQVRQDLVLSTPTNQALFDVSAANHLAGFQTGFDALLLKRQRFEISTLLKAGVYNNDAANSTLITQTCQTCPSYYCDSTADHVAFVGELQVALTYCVTPALCARAGYQALWISGVATAPNQMAVSNPLFGTAMVDASSTVSYQGLFLGLEYRR